MSQAPSLPQRSQVCLQFMNTLQEMQQCAYLCDLTLELKNQKFTVHKVVMSAWSPLIKKLLGSGHSAQETLRIQYDNSEVFGSFLTFLYSCQMDDVAEHNLIQMLHLATSLQVNHIRQVCEEMLKSQLKISNIIATFHLARKYRLPNLEEYTMAYMQMNLPEAVKQADFLSLSPPRFNSFLSSGWVCVMKPEVKLFLIISWLGYDVKERQQYLVLLLKYIDWSTVANDFLNEISQTENFFTTNESSLYLLLQTLFSSMIPLGPYVDSFPALREKYAYLLDHIVQNSFVFPLEVDDFCPVSVHLVSPPQHHSPTFTLGGSSLDCEAGLRNPPVDSVSSIGQASLDYSDMQDLSNDSITAGIGLRMRNVAIADSQSPCSDKVMLSGHAVASGGNDGQGHTTPVREENQEDFKVQLSPESLCLFKSAPPSKVLDIVDKKRKGSVCSKQKATAQVKAGRPSKSKVSGSQKSGKTKETPSPTAKAEMSCPEKSTLVKLDAECDIAGDTSGSQLNRRPRRQAAANFSVPERLLPRARKTKALLKEVMVVPPAESREETDHREVGETECGQENSISDSDVDEDETEEFHEDTKKDPDFNLPRKRTRCFKGNTSQKHRKLSAKSSDSVTISEDIPENFTSMKIKTSNSVTQSPALDLESAQTFKQDADAGKAEENKVGRKGSSWKRKCDQCDYSAPTQNRLDNHMERVHGSRATVYACTVCKYECLWSKSFFEHMKQHFPGPPFICDFEGCGWEADRIQVLLIHRRRHVDERPYKCPQCSAKFRTRNNLIAHFKCHAENKNHECPVCHRRFKMKNTMQQHLVTHSDARPYLCDTCGFSTKFQSHLISHKRIHTGEVFTCNFINCTYSSPKRSQLKAHMRSHLNIRHHVCHICQKSFVEKSHLVRHLKIHQDERPHKCDQCEYSSTRIDKVNEHKRKYHSEEAAKSKRQYKYAPRGRNRIAKTASKTDKKLLGLPSSLTTPHATIVIPGRPIRPKKAKEIHTKSFSIKPSIATLVSAAEELYLADMIEKSDVSQLNSSDTKGKSVKSEKGSSSGNLQIALKHNGEVLVKDEESESSRLVVDLQDADQGPEKRRPSGRVRSVKHNQGPTPMEGTVRKEVKSKAPVIPSSADLSTAMPPTHYTPHPSHTSAALLQQLAASVASESQHSHPPSMNLSSGATLLPHTATHDVHTSSHILLSTRQQHSAAAVSAADSLASLSSGFGLPMGMSSSVSEMSAADGVSHIGGHQQQQQAVSNLQQPFSAQLQPQQQTVPPLPDDCGGLKAFFEVLS
ncbi:uncharacterized protein LOC143284471 [Babylonia areolata]|uniref:uncharacterized protein LOC143284471 n=1 Tax=Babylonia areolata TaxID=304850 RepID=UPI003FD52744